MPDNNKPPLVRLGPELAYVLVSLEQYQSNPSSEYHARVVSHFLNHLPEHVAEEFDVRGEKLVCAPLNTKVTDDEHKLRLCKVRDSVWRILSERHPENLGGNSIRRWIRKISNASKHAVTRKQDCGSDSRAFTSFSEWESDSFMEDFGQVIFHDEVGNRLDFQELIEHIKPQVHVLLAELHIPRADIEALTGPVTGRL